MSQQDHRRKATVVRWGLTIVVFAFAGIPVLKSAEPLARSNDQAVTFAKDIAPILQRSCQQCHRPNSIAPMSLMTYAEVRPYARAIKQRTALRDQRGVMPPWFIDKSLGIQRFKDDISLSEEEIVKIARWADSGAPQGDPADLLPLAKVVTGQGWQIGEPDLIVTSPTVQMKAVAPDWWGSLGEVSSGLTEDRYVAALEYREISQSQGEGRETVGGRFIFHHAGMRAIEPESGENPESSLSWPTHEVGRNADIFDPEAGKLLKAGSRLRFPSVHLHSNGRDTSATLQVGFKFHPRGYRPKKTIRGFTAATIDLDIKGLEANNQAHAYVTLPEHTKVLTFEPHMHASGVRMCVEAIWASTKETLGCTNYDHSWVRVYNYADSAAPLLPKGTILHVTGYFDNTSANKNVVDPRNWQGLGHRSMDNMMIYVGQGIYLTDDEFAQAVAERRADLALADGRPALGCPLCGYSKMPRMTAGNPTR